MSTPALDGIILPAATTRWTDEYDWSPVAQSVERDVFGGLVVEYVSPPADGRPVTLALGWVSKTTLEALVALRDAATQSLMALDLPDGRGLDVIWRHDGGMPIDARPVVDYATSEPTDYYDVTLQLLAVGA